MPVDGTGDSSRAKPSPVMPSTPLSQYISRKSTSRIRTNDLPLEPNAHGVYSPAGFFFVFIGLTVPFAYVYIALILFRELCVNFPDTLYLSLQHYVPWLANVVITMQKSSVFVEAWCVVEAVFYVFLKLKIQWLQRQDPLEASLSSAPMLELDERRELWDRMMEAEKDNPADFLSGWFFDEPIQNISLYDVRDFAAWSMFEGRNQEHLTVEELAQLDEFVQDYEYRLSVDLYGVEDEIVCNTEIDEKKECTADSKYDMEGKPLLLAPKSFDELLVTTAKRRPRPKKLFRFPEESHDDNTNFFTNLYEDFKHKYEQYRNMLETSEFHPVQDIRNFMAETKQHIVEAEESAVATAANMCENAYSTLVSPGSAVDKQLSAIGHATQVHWTEAWNSVKGMREKLETAKFLSSQRKAIRQRLKGYRLNLNRMRSMSSAVPSKQMAVLMRKITECNDALERVEASARNSFMNATGFVGKNLFQRKEPQRYAKYSSDPLLGIATYPLGFHLVILTLTEGGLRIMMRSRGFVRLTVGPVAYYYHPGKNIDDLVDSDEEEPVEKMPIVFVHGIGIGIVFYMPLIDEMLKSGRPLLLPEIPYVNGFRPWQSPYSVLPPAVVVSSMTAMLATHGYLKGVFAGHSYGTSWLSYMCKYAPDAVAALVFLDPICFCLHIPRLTKKFVYHRADPGVISYMIRSDITINCTIQRSFPWARIILFEEQIGVPCSVFLSDRDELVPAEKVENYLRSKGALVKDFTEVDRTHFDTEELNVTVFRGFGHGDWSERLSDVALVADCMDVMCTRVERKSDEFR